MKPFNLEEALAGKPVVTRDGKPAKIVGHNPEAESHYALVGWVEKRVKSWSIEGKYVDNIQHNTDLFMAPETKDVWVVLFSSKNEVYIRSSVVYQDKDLAETMAARVEDAGSILYGIHKITIEV